MHLPPLHEGGPGPESRKTWFHVEQDFFLGELAEYSRGPGGEEAMVFLFEYNTAAFLSRTKHSRLRQHDLARPSLQLTYK